MKTIEEMEALLGPANRMDAPGGPECACGRPSKHESGWCRTLDCMGDVSWEGPLHSLWTKAVGTPDYDKRQWIALEQTIHALKHECRELRKQLTAAEKK